MQDEHPPLGQGPAKLCLRPATACDPAFRSGHFRSKVSLLSGNHGQNITLASKLSSPTTNFAKGSSRQIISGVGSPAEPERSMQALGRASARPKS